MNKIPQFLVKFKRFSFNLIWLIQFNKTLKIDSFIIFTQTFTKMTQLPQSAKNNIKVTHIPLSIEVASSLGIVNFPTEKYNLNL